MSSFPQNFKGICSKLHGYFLTQTNLENNEKLRNYVVEKEIPRKCRKIQYDLCGAKYVMMEGSGKSRLAKFARETSPDSQLGNVPNHIPA